MPGGQSSNTLLNVAPFLMPVLIRHLWQLKTVVFLHWCLIHAALLAPNVISTQQAFENFQFWMSDLWHKIDPP
jgi:hypothetical protein